jgi:hypothetical protein
MSCRQDRGEEGDRTGAVRQLPPSPLARLPTPNLKNKTIRTHRLLLLLCKLLGRHVRSPLGLLLRLVLSAARRAELITARAGEAGQDRTHTARHKARQTGHDKDERRGAVTVVGRLTTGVWRGTRNTHKTAKHASTGQRAPARACVAARKRVAKLGGRVTASVYSHTSTSTHGTNFNMRYVLHVAEESFLGVG